MPPRVTLALLLAIAAQGGCSNREPEDDDLTRTEKAAQQLVPAEATDPYKTGLDDRVNAAATPVTAPFPRDASGNVGQNGQQAAQRSLSDRQPATDLQNDRRRLTDDGGAAPTAEVPVVVEVAPEIATSAARPSSQDLSVSAEQAPSLTRSRSAASFPSADVEAASSLAGERESPARDPAQPTTFAAFSYPDRPHELDAEGWINFLAAADQAMQQAIAAHETGELDRTGFLEAARRISGYKLSAAEALDGAATTPRHEELAVLGKIEALSQLAGLGDRNRVNELLTYAAEHSDFASDDVARQAAVVLLGFSLNRVSGGLSDADPLLEQIDAVLRVPKSLSLPELIMMERSVETLRREGFEDIAKQVRQKTAQAFAESSDASLAMRAWRLGVEGSDELRNFQEAVSQPQPDLRPLTSAIDGLIDTQPSQWTLAALMSEISNLEYAGKPQAAAAIAEAVRRRSDLLRTPEMRREIAAELDAWQRRIDLAGVRPPLDGLVKTDGSPARLEDFDGNYTLLDFWASWCPTCRAEFERIEEVATEFGPRLQVVGINLDADPDAMRQVIEQAELRWPQLRVEAAEGVQPITAPGVAKLGVRSLPFNLLLDPQGRVVASQLHGDQLLARLRELLPKSSTAR